MFKKTIPVAVALALSLSAGAAVADHQFEQASTEAGVTIHYVPGTKSRAQVEAERIEAVKNPMSADGWRYIGGETGWELVQHSYDFRDGVLVRTNVPGTKSRAQVEAERIEAVKNPVSADGGWRYIGGETGWELVQHSYDFRDGRLVHTDKLDHSTPKPSLEGRKLFPEEYSGS